MDEGYCLPPPPKNTVRCEEGWIGFDGIGFLGGEL